MQRKVQAEGRVRPALRAASITRSAEGGTRRNMIRGTIRPMNARLSCRCSGVTLFSVKFGPSAETTKPSCTFSIACRSSSVSSMVSSDAGSAQ